MLVLLGEVGGIEEYRVIEAVKSGAIKKPIVAWAIGTCAKMFATDVQFGHAGSMANSELETAEAKNTAMRAAGFIVPPTFEDLPEVLKATYDKLVKAGEIVEKAEVAPPQIPMDYKWAQELGMIRKPAAFISCVPSRAVPFADVVQHHLRRAWPGAALRRHAHLGRIQGGDWHRRSRFAPLVQAPSASLRLQIPRDGSHAHRRPRESFLAHLPR